MFSFLRSLSPRPSPPSVHPRLPLFVYLAALSLCVCVGRPLLSSFIFWTTTFRSRSFGFFSLFGFPLSKKGNCNLFGSNAFINDAHNREMRGAKWKFRVTDSRTLTPRANDLLIPWNPFRFTFFATSTWPEGISPPQAHWYGKLIPEIRNSNAEKPSNYIYFRGNELFGYQLEADCLPLAKIAARKFSPVKQASLNWSLIGRLFVY